MSFLDVDPDLTSTRFSRDDLNRARDYLVHVIERHDPTWLASPVGPLGVRWREGGTNQAVFLIHFAQMISVIDHNSSKRSKPVLIRRFKDLLRANERQFEEVLTELQVIASLIGNVGDVPVEFEPLVPDNAPSHAHPSSPDYSIPFQDGEIYVEVTVFHLGVLMAWNAAIERIKRAVQESVIEQDGFREVTLSFPPNLTKADISDRALHTLCRKINQDETGTATLRISGETAFVEWTALSPAQSSASSALRMEGNHFAVEGAGVEIGTLVVANTKRLKADASEVVLKSIQNTLRRKRTQAPKAAVYLVAVKLGHHMIDGSLVQKSIVNRIWPNERYRWLSGIVAFEVQYTTANGFKPSMRLLINPNAEHPVPPELQRAFGG